MSGVAASLVERSALAFAHAQQLDSISSIPVEQRAAVVRSVAQALSLPERAVQVELAIHWHETSGRSGQKLAGSALTTASSNHARQGDPKVRPHMMAIAGLTHSAPPKPKDDVIRRSDRMWAALATGEPFKLSVSQATDLQPELLRRGIRLDDHVIQPGIYGPDRVPRVGEYGAVQLSKIKDDDPILDTPIFRGMGSEDPAIHALMITGRLIPAGTSGDYEGFKTYSHRGALDAYEWSLDPFVALKATGGHGYLLKTTLRELRELGKKNVVARKKGDSEGGIFIADTIRPEVRAVGRLTKSYEISRPIPEPTHSNAEKFARMLSAQVPGHGGWDGYLEAGSGKGPQILVTSHAEQTFKQVAFLIRRLSELTPDDPSIDRLRTEAAALNGQDPTARVEGGRKILQNLKIKVANIEAKHAPVEHDPFSL